MRRQFGSEQHSDKLSLLKLSCLLKTLISIMFRTTGIL